VGERLAADVATVMSIPSTNTVLEALRQHGLVDAAPLQELNRKRNQFADPRALAKYLLQRGWLTPYQINQLLNGRAADLVLGPYLLLDRLGEGGKGQVFKVRHRAMNRIVALKILRPELTSDAEVVGRFFREIEIVSQISHPNIVHAFDAGPIELPSPQSGEARIPGHFLAMEFIEGSDLERQVQKCGRMPVLQAVEYIRQAACGLAHAHERGLIHRDIKPANLLVGAVTGSSTGIVAQSSTKVGFSTLRMELTPQAKQYGVVKILDLGLARLRHTATLSPTDNLTVDYGKGVTQGTPDYMAPEQALDFHTADIRADIYSLGCTFFFLLTGQPPFLGGTLAQKLLKHQQVAPPAIGNVRPDVPPAVAKVLDRMLAKRAEARFQTPGEVADALAALFSNGVLASPSSNGVKAPSLPLSKRLASLARPSRSLAGIVLGSIRWLGRTLRQRPRVMLVLALLMLTATSFAFLPLGSESEPSAMKSVLELLHRPDLSEQQILQRLGKLHQKYPGSMGRLRQELLALRMRQPGTAEAFQAGIWLTYLPSPLDQLDPQQISEKKCFAGQPPELVAVLGDLGPTYGRTSALAFRPDCTMLAVSNSGGDVILWHFANGVPTKPANLRAHSSPVMALAFSPDGRWLASGSGNNSAAGDNSLRLWDVTQGEIKADAVLNGHTSTINTLTFSPDGRALASAGEDQSVRMWEMPSRDGKVLATKVTFVRSLAFSPDCDTLAVGGSYWSQVRLFDLVPKNGGKVVDLKYPAAVHTNQVAFSPDGKMLATDFGNQVVMWDPTRQVELFRLNGHATGVSAVVFPPDGKTLFSGEAAPESQTNVNEPETLLIRWSMQNRAQVASWRLPCGGIKRLVLATDGRHLAVGGRNSLVYILRLAPPKIGPGAIRTD
jgi:eukaryotic-like serine/threonine-protein kinase